MMIEYFKETHKIIAKICKYYEEHDSSQFLQTLKDFALKE
jgi:hypothetical protein